MLSRIGDGLAPSPRGGGLGRGSCLNNSLGYAITVSPSPSPSAGVK